MTVQHVQLNNIYVYIYSTICLQDLKWHIEAITTPGRDIVQFWLYTGPMFQTLTKLKQHHMKVSKKFLGSALSLSGNNDRIDVFNTPHPSVTGL